MLLCALGPAVFFSFILVLMGFRILNQPWVLERTTPPGHKVPLSVVRVSSFSATREPGRAPRGALAGASDTAVREWESPTRARDVTPALPVHSL